MSQLSAIRYSLSDELRQPRRFPSPLLLPLPDPPSPSLFPPSLSPSIPPAIGSYQAVNLRWPLTDAQQVTPETDAGIPAAGPSRPPVRLSLYRRRHPGAWPPHTPVLPPQTRQSSGTVTRRWTWVGVILFA